MTLFLPNWFWISLTSLFGFYWINFSFKPDVLYVLQASLTLLAASSFFRQRNFYVFCGLVSIAFADVSYYLHSYKLNLASDSINFYLTTTVPYASGFLLIAVSEYIRVKKIAIAFVKQKISIFPIVILAGASVSFIAAPLYQHILNGTFNINSLSTVTEISTSIPLIILSYIAIISSYNLKDSCFSIGALLIGLVDWGIQFEYITIGKLAFSYYDFFWFLGILLIFLKSSDKTSFAPIEIPQNSSLRTQLKIVVLIASLIPISSYYFLYGSNLSTGIGFFVVGSALSLLVASILSQYFSEQLNSLTREIDQIFSRPSSDINSGYQNEISNEWEDSLKLVLKNRIYNEKMQTAHENLVLQKKAELAKQVSHDIRSPLTALNIVLNEAKELDEEKRILVRNAVNRINDIANTLIVGDSQKEKTEQQSGYKGILISPLIDSVVSEKRVQIREKQCIEIEAEILEGYGLFAIVDPVELKRVISNLVNNSIEAFSENIGKIVVSVHAESHEILINVSDNGSGIPESIKHQLGHMGISFGKGSLKNGSGSGLGIYHAKKTIEEAGGAFEIASTPNLGTTITMRLEKAIPPKWFVENIELSLPKTIVSLDDDISIHQIWRSRIYSSPEENKNLFHKSFTSASSFSSYVERIDKSSLNMHLFLVDFELINQNYDGISIIKKLGIAKQSILVTSRYDEYSIQDACELSGIKLVPKAMAGLVPISISSSFDKIDIVLIDDDPLIRTLWNTHAKRSNKNILFCSGPEDFLIKSESISSEARIFIDSNLGHGVRGEELGRNIYDMGFRNIYLCTGYPSSNFSEMPWIKNVFGKNPDVIEKTFMI